MSRVLLLLPTTTYRTKAFLEAALRLGVEVVVASEHPSTMERKNPAGLITLDFLDPDRSSRDVKEYASEYPVDAVIPVDEDTAIVAASVARALKLRHNMLESVITAKNKFLMRETLSRAGVRVPRYWRFRFDDNIEAASKQLTYPCVIKPVFLSTSRGVMRADNEKEFIAAVGRLEDILRIPEIARRGGAAAREYLVEEFIPGDEVALEGLLTAGKLRTLAIFDKPDPLNGPFFEETIYVTPSRHPQAVQQEIVETTQAAIRAMGLSDCPIHAEIRVNEKGAWVVEVAARAIGGLCSRTLRFTDGRSLEELIIKHALGEDVSAIEREALAAGVMMIPIPRAGVLTAVRGVEEAKSVPDVEDVVISAHISKVVQPPPEGASYLGFIFSRADTAERAEAALREAHGRIEFVIEPQSGAGQ